MKQPKRKILRPLSRKVHIGGEVWTFYAKGHYARIRDPKLAMTYVASQCDITGATWDDIERSHRKGYAYHYAMTPGRIKQYIIDHILDRYMLAERIAGNKKQKGK